ncbi:MAG TPA: hypothetical protein VNF73_15375, partial [Candidatus Saccharimonadales bacterium]|nr:hypothetical protein [Candidatus Saccharimonadales bacterium]
MGPRDPRGSQPDSPHERARELAAERLSLPLPAAEQEWLDGHLRICRPCAAVAAAYAADREALRRLVAPEPPRDLWARTATGLDATERDMAHRKVAGPPAPGFRRLRQGTAPRTIRSIRAERHASAIRSAGFRASMRRSSGRAGVADRPRTPGWLLPFGGLAALAVTIVVGGTALLAQGFNPSAPLIPPGSTTAALGNSSLQPATPIPVGAADVSWLSPGENGSYTWNSAHVDEVCPPVASPDCAPIDGSQSSQLTSLGS